LTAEKFIPCPFSHDPGARLYRTGDLARYLPAGNIECLGRLDDQVKVRGFRIELGEIESTLGRHPLITNCTVVVREHAFGHKQLVAYVVATEGQKLGSREVHDYLRTKLPDYMVPSLTVALEELPLTPNGKVDRRALPAPAYDGESHEAFVAPRTPVEEGLARIWSEILDVERLSIEDNFFDLGGHSLVAAQLISRARNTFSVDLPLRCLFETPTVAGLAETIYKMQTAQTEDSEMAAMLAELDDLSEEEAQLQFAEES
jgi:acyl carrier protein